MCHLLVLLFFLLTGIGAEPEDDFGNLFNPPTVPHAPIGAASRSVSDVITPALHPFSVPWQDGSLRGYYPLFDRRGILDPNFDPYVQRWNLVNVEYIANPRRLPYFQYNPLMDRMRRFGYNIKTAVPSQNARSAARTTNKYRRFALNKTPLYGASPYAPAALPEVPFHLRAARWNSPQSPP